LVEVDELLALCSLLAAATVGGRLATRLKLPALVGMLFAGLALRNVPGNLLGALPDSWSVALRLLALSIILLRAGLGLDLDALRRLHLTFLRLAFLPNLAEAATVAIVAGVLLDMPATWALLLGFVVAAVSPAVVVPSLLELQGRGYGVSKGIPTMVLAAASFDDVLSITGFGLTVSLIFGAQGDGGVTTSLLRAPLELTLGLGVGVLAGVIVSARALGHVRNRGVVLIVLGVGSVAGGWMLGLTGGGSLAAMTMGAVAGRSLRSSAAPIAIALSRVWTFAQIALFGLIGAAVSLDFVEPSYIVSGLVILVAGLIIRLAVSYLSVGGGTFSKQERFFVAVAWIPKATVQAAVGALALDLARQEEMGQAAITYGTQVVTIAVLAIIVTAPIGAIAIARTGPRWLQQSDSSVS
jgi:NhaP-type Na+/H+ or K+/H+ antiporter